MMEGVLNKCLNPTTDMIVNMIEIETSLINTNHPDFIGSADSLLNLFQSKEEMVDEEALQKPAARGSFMADRSPPAKEEPVSQLLSPT